MHELLGLTLLELTEALREKRASAVELMEASVGQSRDSFLEEGPGDRHDFVRVGYPGLWETIGRPDTDLGRDAPNRPAQRDHDAVGPD